MTRPALTHAQRLSFLTESLAEHLTHTIATLTKCAAPHQQAHTRSALPLWPAERRCLHAKPRARPFLFSPQRHDGQLP